MNNPASPEAQTQQLDNNEALQYAPISYLQYWPAIVVGVIISAGIIGLGPNKATPLLVWIPPAILIALLLLAIITMPIRKKAKEEAWEKRAREEALAAAEAAQAKAQEAPVAAAAQEAAPVEAAPAEAPKAAEAPVVAGDVDVLILWGSETGTAQGLAEMTESKLKDTTGLSARAVSMANVTLNALPGFSRVLIITSTWGDGEPPSNGIDLWESFQKQKVDMSKTRFSVLSLGDTAYPQFCKCGKDFDEFMESQGAQRLHPRVDCDLDYEANFDKWLSGIQQAIK
jgi:flavodoxin